MLFVIKRNKKSYQKHGILAVRTDCGYAINEQPHPQGVLELMYRHTLPGIILVLMLAACGTNSQQELPTLVNLDAVPTAATSAATEEVAAEDSPTPRPSPTDPQITLEAVGGIGQPTAPAVPEAVPEEEPPVIDANAAIPDEAPPVPNVSADRGYTFAAVFPSTGGTLNQETIYTAQAAGVREAALYGTGRVELDMVGVDGANRVSFLLTWLETLPAGTYDLTFAQGLTAVDDTMSVAVVRPDVVINATGLTPVNLDSASGTFTLETADPERINAIIQFTADSDAGPLAVTARLKNIVAFELGDS